MTLTRFFAMIGSTFETFHHLLFLFHIETGRSRRGATPLRIWRRRPWVTQQRGGGIFVNETAVIVEHHLLFIAIGVTLEMIEKEN